MSWIEDINTELIIVTGDGKEYRPTWINAEKEVQYNTSSFDFVNKRGTLVYRGKDKGGVYVLELYFQGEDNIDEGREFELSARDSRAWDVSHPIYGSITIQPITMRIDNTRMNSTKITVQAIETITEKLPSSTVAVEDKITQDQEAMNEAITQEFAAEEITASEITEITENNETFFDKAKDSAGDAIDSYYDAFKTANTAVSNAISLPLNAMRQTQTFISAPIKFKETVENRVNTLLTQMQTLRMKITNLTTRGDKVVFEATATGLTGAIAVAAVTDPDYTSVSQTTSVIQSVVSTYNQLLTDLDSLQSDNGGDLDSYIPNAEIVQRIERLVNLTTAGLKQIAIDQRIEYSLITEEDTNVIRLTHRLYGLDPDDENLNDLIDLNEIGINELLEIRKGREIKYYV